MGKCVGLALLFIPEGNISSVVFQRVVVYGMDHAHHLLNNLVVPSVVEFVVSLPWKLLLVLFPTLPDPTSPSSLRNSRSSGKPPGGADGGSGLGSRLQHLKMPENTADGLPIDTRGGRRRASPRRGAVGTAATEKSLSPPPLPQRNLSQQTTQENKTDGIATDGDVGRNDAPIVDSTARKDPEGTLTVEMTVATPARDGAGGEARGSSSGGRSRRRSFGEIIRSTITGNSNVRLRDHLFDLSTASPAPLSQPAQVPTTTPAAVDGNGPNRGQSPVRQHARKLWDESTSDVVVTLPPVSSDNGADRQQRQPSNASGNKTPAGRSPASAETQSRHATRRRPSDFSQNRPGGSGGDAAAGGSSDGLDRGVRRRSLSGRRPSDKKTENSRNVAPGGGSNRVSASNGSIENSTVGASVGGDSPQARTKRLLEWRRRRAEQAEAQPKERPRRVSKTAVAGADSAVPGATAVGGDGSSEGSGRGSGAGKAGRGSGRRFRHVERFRSEMAKTSPGPAGDADAALPARPSRDGASGRSR